MKNILLTLAAIMVTGLLAAQSITAPGVKWNSEYGFDQCNITRIEFYSSKGELMRFMDYKTHFQSYGNDFSVAVVDNKGNVMETVFDKENQVAIQIFGSSSSGTIYNAGGYKYPPESEIKTLEVTPTGITREIAGYSCTKFTYTHKKIFGEVWIANELDMPNDLGLFRSCRMTGKHNTLSVPGFVMEMTTEDSKGGKTLMTTISVNNTESHTVNFRDVEMQTAINKVSYFSF